MTKIPCDPGPANWAGPNPGSFRPSGRLLGYSSGRQLGLAELGAVAWTSEVTLAARLFVGFSVGSVPTWDMDDLVRVVREFLEVHYPENPAATFVAQRGVYKYVSGETVEEQGAQVILINAEGLGARDFEARVVSLAEEVAEDLEQELVIVELQENGVVKKTLGVVP